MLKLLKIVGKKNKIKKNLCFFDEANDTERQSVSLHPLPVGRFPINTLQALPFEK